MKPNCYHQFYKNEHRQFALPECISLNINKTEWENIAIVDCGSSVPYTHNHEIINMKGYEEKVGNT